jgi:hypothetical protein
VQCEPRPRRNPGDIRNVADDIGRLGKGYADLIGHKRLIPRPEARDGAVDLDNVVYVRVVDVVGDGSATDSFGRVIYDPYPTTGSAGFDLEAIAVLHQQ